MTDTINGFAPGSRVRFTTAGRYRTEQVGELLGLDNGFAQVKTTDGLVKKTRPSTLRAG